MSIKRVLDAAMLSSFAHKTEEQVKEALKNTSYEFQKFISDGYLQCYIAKEKDSKNQVIVFRESTDKKDWYANLNFFPIKTAYGTFHRMYFKKLYKVRIEIMKYIKDKNFVCIGFSQGASLARLFAHIITKREVLSGYKPFFVSFEPAMESKTDNYNEYGIYTIKGNDIVPMLPLKLTGWNHSGKLLYITGIKAKIIVEPSRVKKSLMVITDTVMDYEDEFNTDDISRDHSVLVIYNQCWTKEKNQEKIINVCKSFGLK